MRILQDRKREGGTAITETVVSMAVLFPLLIAGSSLGINLIRSMQAQQVCRDAAHMYAQWVDFSLSGNQQLLLQMAGGLGITQAGGSGVIILSQVTPITLADCTGAGYNSTNCTNMNYYVVTERIYIGDSTLRSSSFGTPAEAGINQTTRDINNMFLDSTARAGGFSSILTLNDGEIAFVAEIYVKGAAWNATGIAGFAGNSIYSRSIF